MAETFLGPIIEKLTKLLIEEAQSLKGVRRDVKSLKDELEIIEPFLEDAEAKVEKGDRVVDASSKAWLKQIREEAERIECVVDYYVYRIERHRHDGGFIGAFRRGCHFFKAFKARNAIASEIQDIKASLREIKDRGIGYGLRPLERGSSSRSTNEPERPHDPRLGSLFVEDDDVVCIAASEELRRRLIEGEPTRSVTSLAGQGGIGKTTLAAKVCNDEAVKAHFDCDAWITVSQSYDLKNLLGILSRQVNLPRRITEGECNIDELIRALREFLQTRRYLVVLDDVWQKDIWNEMKYALPRNNNGSRIIITTRNYDVAGFCMENSCDLVKELPPWFSEMAWPLFCKKAFRDDQFEGRCPQELEQLSKDILRKCRGLPLAIATIAGVLSTKQKSVFEWQNVLNNLNSEFEKTDIEKILSLSYFDLPQHLRRCFLYFGVFPEDYRIYDNQLYGLWIAEGFVKETSKKTPEEVAEEYLNELIHRNLVLVKTKYGTSKECSVHDLMYDIILTYADEWKFCKSLKGGKSSLGERSSRLSVYGSTENFLKTIADSSIRSVFFFGFNELSKSVVVGLGEKSKLLKVLNLSNAPIDNLPKEVGNFFHLRYLCLSRTKVKKLPKSIGKLRNLQTLDVSNTLVQELPVEINKLTNLRHIFAYSKDWKIDFSLESFRGVKMNEGMGRLEDLQTLTRIEAYPGREVCFANELRKLTNLRSLSILKVTAEMGKALGASIEKMDHLKELTLTLTNEGDVLDLGVISSPPRLLRWLQLNCRLQQLPVWIKMLDNLQMLDLRFSRLVDEPLGLLRGLSNLVFLRLHQAYDGEELHFEEGSFPKLKELRLGKLEGLKVVKIDNGALPFLEKLDFGPFPLMMEPTSFDIQQLTSLKSLKILDMPREFVLGLQPGGGPYHSKIQHVPTVRFCYKNRAGRSDVYKLESSELLQRLQAQGN